MQIGEFVSDYVEVRRDYRDWTPDYQRHGARDGSDTGASTPTAAGDRHGQPELGGGRHHSPVSMDRSKSTSDGLGTISEKPAEESS